jgi:hypothetical protein
MFFVCANSVLIMRHGVNLAAHLQFKTSPKLFEQANKATNEHIKRAAQILAKRGKASIDDSAAVIEDKCLQDGHILVHLVFFKL